MSGCFFSETRCTAPHHGVVTVLQWTEEGWMHSRCKRLGYCEQYIPAITELFIDASDTFFARILHNRIYVLQPFYKNVLFRLIC